MVNYFEPGKNVSLILRNGMTISGKIIFWSDKESYIEISENNIACILKTSEDVLLARINMIKKEEKQIYEITEESIDDYKSIDLSAEEKIKLRAKNLADLHEDKIVQEKLAIKKKLLSFENKGAQHIQYQPQHNLFIKK